MNIQKLTLILLFSFTFILYTNAQTPITITSADMPSSGSKYLFSITPPIVDLKLDSTGSNYFWDYSEFISLNQKLDTFESAFLIYLAMGSTTAMQSIDSIISIEDFANGRPLFRKNNSQWSMNGFLPNDFLIPMLFETADVIYKFPMEFENIDTSHSRFIIDFPGIIYYEREMTRINHVDGWGTLNTPFGIFEVLRIKSVLIQTDSVAFDSTGFKIDIPDLIEYKWLGKQHGLPLMQVNAYIIDGVIIPFSIEYQDSLRIVPPTPPILIAPFNFETDVILFPEMKWSHIYNADSYSLQISKNMMFSDLILDSTGIISTTFNLPEGLLEAENTYFWRVNAVNTAGVSNWSNRWQFSTANTPSAPKLSFPANNAHGVSTMITFTWEASANAASYNFLISEDQNFNNPLLDESNINTTLFTFPGSLSNNTKYFWKVRAKNAIGYSEFSETWSFTTQSPSSVFENLIIQDKINVFPNPAKDALNFKISLTSAGYASIYITDALGRKVVSVQNKSLAANEHTIEVDVSKLKNGIYFYQIVTEKENWFGKVEIVNRVN